MPRPLTPETFDKVITPKPLRQKITVTAECLRRLWTYDPSTNLFYWRVASGHKKVGDLAGGNGPQVSIDGILHNRNDLVLLYQGKPPATRRRHRRDEDRPWCQLGLTYDHYWKLQKRGVDPVEYAAKKRKKLRPRPILAGAAELKTARELRALGLPEENIAAHIKGLKQAKLVREASKSYYKHQQESE